MYSKSLPPLRYLIAFPYNTKHHITRTKSLTRKSFISVRCVFVGPRPSPHITLHCKGAYRPMQLKSSILQRSKKTSARRCESSIRMVYLNSKLNLRKQIDCFGLAVPLCSASMGMSLCVNLSVVQSVWRSTLPAIVCNCG